VGRVLHDKIRAMKDSILITGFEPFGGEALNPSREVARALDGRRIAGHRVVGRCLPCAFGSAAGAMQALVDELQPAVVIALGLAGSRSAVSIERVAINLIDARIADNAGAQPIDRPVIDGAPAAYFSRLPVKALHAGLREAGLAAEVSHSAGTFVCNQVFFSLMHRLRAWGPVRGGFIHLPPLPQQAAAHPASRPMALEEQVRAIHLAAGIAVTRTSDAGHTTGAVD
jgi:pyroglutamyl-peptidase